MALAASAIRRSMQVTLGASATRVPGRRSGGCARLGREHVVDPGERLFLVGLARVLQLGGEQALGAHQQLALTARETLLVLPAGEVADHAGQLAGIARLELLLVRAEAAAPGGLPLASGARSDPA